MTLTKKLLLVHDFTKDPVFTTEKIADFVYFDGKIIIFMIFRVEQSLGTMITFERLITCRQRAVLRFNIGSFEPTLATQPSNV